MRKDTGCSCFDRSSANFRATCWVVFPSLFAVFSTCRERLKIELSHSSPKCLSNSSSPATYPYCSSAQLTIPAKEEEEGIISKRRKEKRRKKKKRKEVKSDNYFAVVEDSRLFVCGLVVWFGLVCSIPIRFTKKSGM